MPQCAFKSCKNNYRKSNVSTGVSYFRFPCNPLTSAEWSSIVARERTDGLYKPAKNSVICSDHFDKVDITRNTNRLRLVKNAIPKLQIQPASEDKHLMTPNTQLPESDTDEVMGILVISSNTTKKGDAICRVCLSCDRTLHEMQRSGLEEPYVQLTGVNPRSSAALPQAVCGYCAHLLRKFHKLQESALLANDTLHNLLREHGQVSEDLLAAVDFKPNPFLLVARAQPPTSCVPTKHPTSDLELKIETDSFIDNDEALSNSDEIEGKLDDHDLDTKIEIVDEFSETPPNDDEKCKSEELTEYLDFNILGENTGSVESDSSLSSRPTNYLESIQTNKLDHKPQPKKRTKRNPTTQPKRREIDTFLENITVERFTPEEQKAHVVGRKDAENYKTSPYKCDFCFRGFNKQATFEVHLKKHTDVEKYGTLECPACKLLYRNKKSLQDHVHVSHAVRYSCRRCSFVTVSKTLAKEHNLYHEGKKYPCSLCGDVYVSKSGYLSHLRIVHPSNVVCELCGYSFVNLIGLHFHKKLKHRDTNHQLPPDAPACALCDIKFISEAALRTHQLVSPKHQGPEGKKYRNDGQSLYLINKSTDGPTTTATRQSTIKTLQHAQCEKCDAQFSSYREYFYHFRRQHPGETRALGKVQHRIMCDVCGKVFQSNWHLRDHMALHAAGAASWQCPKCPKTFKTKSKMFAHKTTHRKENTECSVCGKIIRHHCNIRRHMMTHWAVKPVGCGSCDQRFTSKTDVKNHYRHKHLGVPYPTKKCQRRRRPPINVSMENQAEPAEDLHQNEPDED